VTDRLPRPPANPVFTSIVVLIYYITDRRQLPRAAGESPEDVLRKQVRAAMRAGVDYVQIREKDLEGRALAELVESIAGMPEKKTARLLVNERADIARSCGADGVHLPADSLPVAAVRNWVGKNWIVGVACHSVAEVERAAEAGADYVLVAPVFDTASKPGMKPMGLAAFGEICRRAAVPVFALGGVTESNARSCIEAGAKGLAGIRLFQQAPDLDRVCRQLRAL
jgi:thiamine-phosphate pyrophosphorylase